MKIAIITGSRADWNGLGMVGKVLRDVDKADVRVIAIGQHADSQESLETIIWDGFDPKLLRTNTRDDMAIGCGRATIAISGALAYDSPDMVLICGDRFEILGAASAAALHGIPIAHIGGGDTTEGSIDDRLRYAISALADLHFVTNMYAQAHMVATLNGKVYLTGNPALDRIQQIELLSRARLFNAIGMKENRNNILVVFHAATSEREPANGCAAMIAALSDIKDAAFLILGTNADTGSGEIDMQLRHFAKSGRAVFRENLTPELFHNALEHFDCMIGNSSAGIIETAWHGIPVVNIGNRQKGRPQPDNVWNCGNGQDVIALTLQSALGSTRARRNNPYGNGDSAPRVAKIIVDYLRNVSREN